MIVLAESNFVFEIALRQDEEEHASAILDLAEAGKIRLAVPAYALVEPLHKLARIKRLRGDLAQALDKELAEMARSADFSTVRESSTATVAALARKSDVDKSEYGKVVDRLLRCAEVVPLTGAVIRAARSRELLDLASQDALIFESVVSFLAQNAGTPSIFPNKNSHDFLTETVEGDLRKLDCIVLPTFRAARGRIEAMLR